MFEQWVSHSAQEQYDHPARTVLTLPRRWPADDMAGESWIMVEEYSPGARHAFQNWVLI